MTVFPTRLKFRCQWFVLPARRSQMPPLFFWFISIIVIPYYLPYRYWGEDNVLLLTMTIIGNRNRHKSLPYVRGFYSYFCIYKSTSYSVTRTSHDKCPYRRPLLLVRNHHVWLFCSFFWTFFLNYQKVVSERPHAVRGGGGGGQASGCGTLLLLENS